MNTILTPTRTILVGIAFLLICLHSPVGMALPSGSNNSDPLNNIKEFHANFMNNEIYNKQNSNIGQLKLPRDTIVFPWASPQVSGIKSDTGFRSIQPQNVKIIMRGSQAEESVQDLEAINAAKQRDILYDESQRGNSKSSNLSNSMEVSVQGTPRKEEQHYNSLNSFESDDPEKLVDNAMSSDAQKNTSAKHSLGNYLNIDVSGITVSAINTVEGGSAVATSNIIIKPVQVIDSSSQASDKV